MTLRTWQISIVHEVLFNDRIEVVAETKAEAIEKAKTAFVEKPEQSRLVEVRVVEVEEVV